MLKKLDTVFRRYDDLADFRRNSKLSAGVQTVKKGSEEIRCPFLPSI